MSKRCSGRESAGEELVWLESGARSYLSRTIVIIVIGMAIGYAIMQLLGEQRENIEIGQKAPNFTLTDLQGETVELTEYRGKGVLLNFWASWCDPCVHEMPLLNKTYDQLPGVEIVAVNVGEKREKASQFAARHGIKLRILIDHQGDIKNKYNVEGLPVTYLIDDKGRIVEKMTGELPSSEMIMDLMKRVQPKPELR